MDLVPDLFRIPPIRTDLYGFQEICKVITYFRQFWMQILNGKLFIFDMKFMQTTEVHLQMEICFYSWCIQLSCRMDRTIWWNQILFVGLIAQKTCLVRREQSTYKSSWIFHQIFSLKTYREYETTGMENHQSINWTLLDQASQSYRKELATILGFRTSYWIWNYEQTHSQSEFFPE